jgi:sporulation protein YlmC with PRC-barrel domain
MLNIKMSDELKGKEVVDNSGNKIGEISNVKQTLNLIKLNLWLLQKEESQLKWDLDIKSRIIY